jgi:hypothetical protein
MGSLTESEGLVDLDIARRCDSVGDAWKKAEGKVIGDEEANVQQI